MKKIVFLCILFKCIFTIAQLKISSNTSIQSMKMSIKTIDYLFEETNVLIVYGDRKENKLFTQGIEKVSDSEYVIFESSERRTSYYDCISISITNNKVKIKEYYGFLSRAGNKTIMVPDFIGGEIKYNLEYFVDQRRVENFISYFKELIRHILDGGDPNLIILQKI